MFEVVNVIDFNMFSGNIDNVQLQHIHTQTPHYQYEAQFPAPLSNLETHIDFIPFQSPKHNSL